MKRINITQAATVFGVAGLLGVASIAFAGDQNPAVTDPAKIQKFANVVVINATPEERAASPKVSPTVGQKAGIDPETGLLRPLTAQESAALSPAVKAVPNDLAAADKASAASAVFTTDSGLKGVNLDESSLAYAVVTVGPDGKLRQACIEGQPNAEAALQAAAAQPGVNKNEK